MGEGYTTEGVRTTSGTKIVLSGSTPSRCGSARRSLRWKLPPERFACWDVKDGKKHVRLYCSGQSNSFCSTQATLRYIIELGAFWGSIFTGDVIRITDLVRLPPKTSPPLSDHTMASFKGTASAPISASHLSKLSVASLLCLKKYTQMYVEKSSLMNRMYFLPPRDSTGSAPRNPRTLSPSSFLRESL